MLPGNLEFLILVYLFWNVPSDLINIKF
jgi:hypothetical protein